MSSALGHHPPRELLSPLRTQIKVSPFIGRVRCPPWDSPSPVPQAATDGLREQPGRPGVLTLAAGCVGREQQGAGHLHPPSHRTPCATTSLHLDTPSFGPEQGLGMGVVIPTIQIGKLR